MKSGSSVLLPGLLLLLLCIVLPAAAASPEELARLVAKQLVSAEGTDFLDYNYGASIIIDALYEGMGMGLFDHGAVLEERLNRYESDPSEVAYKFLHAIDLPWDKSVGDHYGLPPISLMARAQYYREHPQQRPASYDNATDLRVAQLTADKYVVPFPRRLDDGSFWRQEKGEWKTDGKRFLWLDDLYMGHGLLVRLTMLSGNQHYASLIADAQLSFANRFRNPVDGIWHHGFNEDKQERSPCKWARANGWAMMSHLEALRALKNIPGSHPATMSIRAILLDHADAVAKLQDPSDGRWHQVLDDNSTFLETSSTAMFMWTYAWAVAEKYLDGKVFLPVVEKAWTGLQKAILPDGKITGVCVGTSIGNDVSFYNNRPTTFTKAAPGHGSVLRAILSMCQPVAIQH